MKYSEYEIAFSPARLKKYLDACNGDRLKAISLYRHNIKLCQKFYGILNVFEVVLRNAINIHYCNYFTDQNWIRNQYKTGGMLEKAPHRTEIGKTIEMLIRQGKYSNDRIVSSVSFGFWTYLFNRIPFRAGGMNLLQIFPYKTTGLGQRMIYNELQDIKAFRNRIAHHEAICFNAQGHLDLNNAKEKLELIKKYLSFMGYNPVELCWGTGIRPYSLFEKLSKF